MDSLTLLAETFAPLAGKRLLDIGCGGGHLARALAARGAEVTGIDPGPEAIAAARHVAPDARFEEASADALPFPDGVFDGAILLNSLHHIPGRAMRAALAEAGRVTRPGGAVVVIEPLPEGDFFEAARPIEDETEMRGEAQAALAAALAGGGFERLRTVTFVRRESVNGFAAFVERLVSVDPARRAVVDRDRARVEAAFRAAATREQDGRYRLDQPMKADILRPVRATIA